MASESNSEALAKALAYAQACARCEPNTSGNCPERTLLLSVRDALFTGVKKTPGAKKRRRQDEVANRPCSPSLFKQALPQATEAAAASAQQAGPQSKRIVLSEKVESILGSVAAYYDRPQSIQVAPEDKLVPAHRYSSLGYVLLPIRRPQLLEKWTAHEIAVFEAGLCVHGKKFDVIKTLLPQKTTRDVIEFYYVWKNTSHKPTWKKTFRAFE